MKTLNKKLFFVLIILIVFGSSVALFVYKHRQIKNQAEISVGQKQELDEQLGNIPESKQNSTSTPISATSTFKTYRNEEWDFEFRYHQDWVVRENTFGSYYSKFNLVIRPATGRYSRFPVSINIVLPEFPERSFREVEKITSEVTVDGIPGIKYQYIFEGSQEIAIILPLNDLRMIIGTDDEQYTEIFNQIISTFKFLNKND